MESRLGDKLTDYIRHYLMMEGSIVKQNDVYHSLKERVDQNNAVDYIKKLSEASKNYQKLLNPDYEEDIYIKKFLKRLNRIEVTTAYPLILNFYKKYNEHSLTAANFIIALKLLENFLIRRFVCGFPTNQLNKIFPTIIISLNTNYENNIVEGVKSILPSKGYPKNSAFRKNIVESKLYGGGDRAIKTKLILESVEESYEHREAVPFDNLTIEHIMPQTLSEWWQNYLGEEWEIVYELQLHSIGNLTLTAYNSELSNADYFSKKEYYAESHLELNKYFVNVPQWKKEDIERRAMILSESIINIWPYYGPDDPEGSEVQDFTGTSPRMLIILGQYFSVSSWRDVLENTLNALADLDPETFELLITEHPKFLNKDRNKLRAIRELRNGCFVEVNLSAKSVEKFCRQTIEFFELSSDDWKIQVA